MKTHTHPKTLFIAAAGVAAALALSACGAGAAPEAAGSSGSSGSAEPASSEGAEHASKETSEAVPRLVVTTDAGVTVLDAASLEVVDSLPLEAPANRMTVGSEDRFVYLSSTKTGVTRILDAGSYAKPHGDHSHYFTRQPRLMEPTLTGERPIHQVSDGGRTAIFYDGTGTADVFREAGLLIGELDVHKVETGSGQHGVVVPFGEDLLVSIPSGTKDDFLPIGVQRVDAQGKEIARYEQCPELHGEAITEKGTAAFGCEGSVLVVDGAGARTVATPSATGDRVGQLVAAPESEILVGDLAANELSVIDVVSGAFSVLPLEAELVSLARGIHGEAIALIANGNLVVIDPVSGVSEKTITVTGPITVSDDHSAVVPRIAVVGHTAYLTDPAAATLTAIDLEAGTIAQSVTIDSKPLNVVAVNAKHAH